MNKIYTQNGFKISTLLHFALIAVTSIALSTGCVKKRDQPVSAAPSGAPELIDGVPTKSGFPHTQNWKATHPEFYLKNPVAVGKVSQDCAKCHDSLTSAKSLNIGCGQNCHQQKSSDVGTPGTPGLWTPSPSTGSVCVSCHKDHTDSKFGHAPSAKGRCLTCHSKDEMHSANPKENKTTPVVASASLCLKCHVSVDTHIVSHPGIKTGKACVACHNPHGSTKHFFVREKLATNCLECHATVKAEINSGNVHTGADGESACIDCHSAHGSDYAKILKIQMPFGTDVKYNAGEKNTYGLCFQCHDAGMLDEKIEPSVTSFRHDSKKESGEINRYNLHRVHVIDQGDNSGYSCIQCHSPHGSAQSASIRPFRVNSPTDKTTIIYKQTSKGGECNASCHSDDHYKYERM